MSIDARGRFPALPASLFGRVLFAALLALVGLMLAVFWAWAVPSIGTVQLTPSSIAPGTPTSVQVTAMIDDPNVIASTVNLQRVNDVGAVLAIVGTLHDDGLDGDAVAGDRIYTLVAVFSETDSVRLRVSAGFKRMLRRVFSGEVLLKVNRPPVADAGRDRDVAVGTDVDVDGHKSHDPDDDRLVFLWTLEERPAGSAAELYGANRVRPVFFADEPGDYRLKLVVSDGEVESAVPAYVHIHAAATNAAPSADAGPDQDVAVGAAVRLDARGSSDPEGASLAYAWQLVDRPVPSSATLDDPSAAMPVFQADVAGHYVVRLDVSDGSAAAVPDEITVTAHAGNTPPTAVPGQDQDVAPASRVELDASASFDPDAGDRITQYAWTFVAVPAGSAAAFSPQVLPNPPQTGFFADLAGDYLIQLVVGDQRGGKSAPRRMLVRAGSPGPFKPAIARLVPDRALAGSAALLLTVEGLRFHAAAKVVFGTTPLSTRFIGAKRLEADMPASLLALPGSFPVLVRNPSAAGGDSNSRPFTVEAAVPILSAVTPATLDVGRAETLVATGVNFTPLSAVHFGGTPLTTTFGNSTRLTATVPAALLAAPATVPVSVVDPAAGISNAINVSVGNRLAITAISPTEGPPGTLVTIDGSGFAATVGGNQVSVGGTMAGVVSAGENRLQATVALAANSGAVTVTNASGTASGPTFTVKREQDFAIVASPAEIAAVPGSTTAVMVQLASTGVKPLTTAAQLSVAGLPAGVTAGFSIPALAAGQTASLSLALPPTIAAGTYSGRIDGIATIDGAAQTRSSTFQLKVTGVTGTTGVVGRFVDDQGRGIAGILVRAEEAPVAASNLAQTTTDAGGNFLFTGLPAGPITLRIDATPANPGFPIWPYTFVAEAGKITPLSNWVVQPPPRDDLFKPLIANHSDDQLFSNPDTPGLSLRVPAGVTIEGWDQVVKSRLAIERVEPDELPTEAVPGGAKSYYRISFGTPMGGVPLNSGSGPSAVFVTAPNDMGLKPGDKADHWYYYGSPLAGIGGWHKAGTGTVSADGKTITADADSGIDRFCGVCGLSCFTSNWQNPSPPCPDCDVQGPPQRAGVNPVTLAMGMELSTAVDMVIDGVMPITIGRSYYPWTTFINNAALSSSLGHGWMFSYDWIVYVDPGTGEVRLVLPGNARGITFTPAGANTYEAPNDLRFGGAQLIAGDGWQLRFKDGRLWKFRQIGFVHWLSEQHDARGNVLRIERDDTARPTTITAPGRSVAIGVSATGRIEVVRDATGRELHYAYTNDRLSTVTAPDGGVTRYSYVEPPPPQITSAAGSGGGGGGGGAVNVSSSYPNRADGPVYLLSVSRPGTTHALALDYGETFRVLRQVVRNPGAPQSILQEVRFAYELNGACAKRANQIVGGCDWANGPREDSYENREAGWRFFGGEVVAARVYDTAGTGYKVRFNAGGLGTELIDADGQSTHFERDARNRITRITDPLGRVTQYAYDGNSNITQIIDAAGRSTQLAYHPTWNKVTSITRSLSGTNSVSFRFEYEDAQASGGKLLRSIDPLGNVTHFSYTDAGGAKGLVQKVTDPLGNVTTLAYSSSADLATVTDALGNAVAFDRDLVGRLQRLTDALGASTVSDYSPVDQLTQITDANTGVTRFSYDAKRDPTAVVDPLGHSVESYVSDDLHRLTRRTDARGGVESYEYDTASRLLAATDRKGQRVNLEYDRQNRVRSITYVGGNTEYRDYDTVGRLVRIRDNVGTIVLDYDNVDRVVRETTDVGGLVNKVEYEYDALDRRVKRTVNGADPTTYSYDLASRLTTIGFRSRSVAYEWDNASRLTAKVLPNGIRQEYIYDNASRLVAIYFRKSDNTLIDSIVYGYDANGRRVSRTTGLLSNVETPMQGSYDEASRMTSVSFPTATRTCTMTYDANGNLATRTCPVGDSNEITTYTWDARDRLIAIAGPGLTASFKYDALGRRVQREVNGQVTGYLYDGVQAVAEFGANDAALLTGLAIDEAIGRFGASGDRTLLTDALGSVVAETRADQTIGTLYGYSPYGETVRSGQDSGNSTQYTGRENDGTGMYYYRARYYDPVGKHFQAEDPIGISGGINQYQYAASSPVNFGDPLGLQPRGSYEVHSRNPSARPGDSASWSFVSDFFGFFARLERRLARTYGYNDELVAYLHRTPSICDPRSDWYWIQNEKRKSSARAALRHAAIYYASTNLLSGFFGYATKKTGSQSEGAFEQYLGESPHELGFGRPSRSDSRSRGEAGGDCWLFSPSCR